MKLKKKTKYLLQKNNVKLHFLNKMYPNVNKCKKDYPDKITVS